MKIAETGEPGCSVGEHKCSVEQGGVGYQRVIPQGLQNMAVKQADKGPCAAAAGAVKTEVFVQHAGGQGKMWQEYIIKQYPCHKAYSQENASQAK